MIWKRFRDFIGLGIGNQGGGGVWIGFFLGFCVG